MPGPTPCDCGQPHTFDWREPTTGRVITLPTCAGHVTLDRATYTRGQDRKPLKQPRPCRNRRPRHAEPDWTCLRHGGAAPQVREKREREMTESRARSLAARWSVPIETTPTDAILGRVSAYAGHVRFYGEMVAQLSPDELTWGVVRETEGDVVVGNGKDASLDRAEGVVREARPNVWLRLYDEASDRLVRFAAEALRAGVQERAIRLAEEQGALVANVLRAVAARLNLTPEQAAEFAVAAPEELRRLYAA